jgi:parallel beta-helix repeat protein
MRDFIHSFLFILFLALAIIIVMNCKTTLSPTKYYIDSINGNDSNIGLAPKQAFKTISKANQVVRAGDTVIISSGTFSGQTIRPETSGTPSARITYKVAPGATVIIKSADHLINLNNRSYIAIGGPITFKSPNLSWAQLNNAHYNEIKDNTFIGHGVKTAYSGVLLSSPASYNNILNSNFRNWGGIENQWGDAIRIEGGAHHNLIEGNSFINAGHALIDLNSSYNVVRNNYLENNWQKGLDLIWRTKPSWAPDHDFVTQFNVVENNTLTKMGLTSNGKGGVGIQLAAAKNIIRRNVFIGADLGGIEINGFPGSTNVNGNRIYHNTFVENGSGGEGLLGGITITQWGHTNKKQHSHSK